MRIIGLFFSVLLGCCPLLSYAKVSGHNSIFIGSKYMDREDWGQGSLDQSIEYGTKFELFDDKQPGFNLVFYYLTSSKSESGVGEASVEEFRFGLGKRIQIRPSNPLLEFDLLLGAGPARVKASLELVDSTHRELDAQDMGVWGGISATKVFFNYMLVGVDLSASEVQIDGISAGGKRIGLLLGVAW